MLSDSLKISEIHYNVSQLKESEKQKKCIWN